MGNIVRDLGGKYNENSLEIPLRALPWVGFDYEKFTP